MIESWNIPEEINISGNDKKIKLSDEELEYIKVAGPIRVGVDTSRPPFEYKNKNTGELKGISIELLNYI